MASKECNISKAAKSSEQGELASKTPVGREKKAAAPKMGKANKKRRIRIVGVSGENLIKKVLRAYYRELRLKAVASRHGHLAADTAESTKNEPKKWPHVFERCLHGDWLCGDGYRYNRMTVEERAELDQFESDSRRDQKQREFEAKYGPGHRL